MTQLEGKYKLELNYPGDGRIFLNFWDFMHGHDVVAELKDGKLWHEENEKEIEISFFEFINKVEESIKLQSA